MLLKMGEPSDRSFLLGDLAARHTAFNGALGMSSEGRLIEAYYFPGVFDNRAMVIGGVHGSELSSISVARSLIQLLSNGHLLYYDVTAIPSLFPDNAALAASHPLQVGSLRNIATD